MKRLTRTIIVLVVFNLAMGSFALAQQSPAEPVPKPILPTPAPPEQPVIPVPETVGLPVPPTLPAPMVWVAVCAKRIPARLPDGLSAVVG